MLPNSRGTLLAAAVGLGLLGWIAATVTNPSEVAAGTRVTAPVTHDNLAVYFLHGPDAVDDSRVVTLPEALARGLAVVHETGTVNTLTVENLSPDCDVFLQSGDIVKGGRQDRLIASDMLVPPGSGKVPVASHCVEQGRWTGRGSEASTRFARCDNFAVGNALKLANVSRNQGAVWANVADSQKKLSDNLKTTVNAAESPTSLQLALENAAVRGSAADYEQALRAAGELRRGVVGVVFAVNGKVTTAEVYGSNGLFRRAWPKLLTAAAIEAVAERPAGATVRPPTAGEVQTFLASAATGGESSGGAPAPNAAAPDPEPQPTVALGANVNSNAGLNGSLVIVNPAPNAPAQAGVTIQLDAALGNVQIPDERASYAGRDGTVGQLPARAAGGNNFARPSALPQPNAGGSAVIVEARDPKQANAVIHRSYIKK